MPVEQFNRTTVGLDIGTDALRMVALQHAQSGPVVQRVGELIIPPHYVVDGLITNRGGMIQAVQQLIQSAALETDRVVVSLCDRLAVVKKISVGWDKGLKNSDFQAWFYWEVEQHLLDSTEHYIIDFALLEEGEERVEVLFTAVRRKVIEYYKSLVEQAGLKPQVISPAIIALVNAATYNYTLPDDGLTAVVNVEGGFITLVVLRGQLDQFGWTLALPDRQWLMWRGENLVLATGEEEQSSLILSSLARCAGQRLKTLVETSAANGEIPLKQILVSGEGASSETLQEFLAEEFEVAVEVANPFQALGIKGDAYATDMTATTQNAQARFLIATGLALHPSA